MAHGIEPLYSKKQVNRVGEAFRGGPVLDLAAHVILDNWRASHAYVINTFQANLRRRLRDTGFPVGQRLKRRPTIIDKLTRQPKMKLARMNDIAGCRIILPDVDSMIAFRNNFCESRAKHERVTEARDQFNYLANPKRSGYRGIHDVYRYKSSAPSSKPWHGLLIELQYRTKAQHAWSTAVETADLLTRSRGKFSEGDDIYQEFFHCCSEIIARTREGHTSCLGHLSEAELKKKFLEIERETHILRLLKGAHQLTPAAYLGHIKSNKNVVLVYMYEKKNPDDPSLYLTPYNNTKDAVNGYKEKEERWKGKGDVVLIKSSDADDIAHVFQNYFNDTTDFVQYMESGLRQL